MYLPDDGFMKSRNIYYILLELTNVISLNRCVVTVSVKRFKTEKVEEHEL
jgi:hypothetical protein